jgi:hypothetical protein
MTADDWDPLPDDAAAVHPGERADLAPRAAPAPPVVPPPPLTPEAAAALAALQAKLHQGQQPRSLVAAVQQREAKQRRRAVAGKVLAACSTVHADIAPPPLPLQYDQGADGRDPREEEPWFAALPAPERERLHREWAADRTRFDHVAVDRFRGVRRSMAEGAFVMGMLGVLSSLLLGGFGMVPALAGGGALAAGLAKAVGAGRFGYAWAGGAVYAALMCETFFRVPLAFVGLLMAAYGMGALGASEEMRRTGGFREA